MSLRDERHKVAELRDRAESEEDWQTVVDCEEALDPSDEECQAAAMSRLRTVLSVLDRLKEMP